MYSTQSNIVQSQEGLSGWIDIAFWFPEITKVATKVQERANWNKGISCYPLMWEGKGCITVPQAETIIKAYLYLTKNSVDSIPEYDRKNNPQAIDEIEKAVSVYSKLPFIKVRIILWELYWAVMSDQEIDLIYLFPNTYPQRQTAMTNAANDIAKENNDADSPLQWLNALKWVVFVGVGAFAVGSVAKLIYSTKL